MGTTLDNGTYLPDEGERNCYDGLAGNWVALDNHLGSTDIHVTINDKQAWNGHIADTDKHVTTTDKATWNAVTSKADDNAVVHLTGNEQSTGFKQFDNIRLNDSIRAINLDNQTVDLNNCYSTFAPSGASGNGNIQYFCCNTNGATANISNLPEKVSFFLESVTFRVVTGVSHVKQTLYCYGNKTYVRYYNGVTWTPWNNIHDELEPSALGMPDFSNGIDISSYITLGTSSNNYTAPANGWICIKGVSSSTAGMYVESTNGFYALANSVVDINSTSRFTNLSFPVVKGEQYTIVLKSVNTSITAKFFPCKGNV